MLFLLISRFYDTNINHFLQLEINVIWKVLRKLLNSESDAKVCLLIAAHDASRADSMWRIQLLKKIFGIDNVYIGKIPEGLTFDKYADLSEMMQWKPNMSMVSPFDFNYTCSPEDSSSYAELIARVKKDACFDAVKKGVLFIDRIKGRQLFDKKTGRKLRDLFTERDPSTRVTTFDGLSLDEQMSLVRESHTIVGVHGAALTNIIFADRNSRVFEISFRRYWCCDPVCKDHMTGKLRYEDECSNRTKHPYHKADYRNLSVAFGLMYTEVQNEGCEGFGNENPISLAKIYVDGEALLSQVFGAAEKYYTNYPTDRNQYIL